MLLGVLHAAQSQEERAAHAQRHRSPGCLPAVAATSSVHVGPGEARNDSSAEFSSVGKFIRVNMSPALSVSPAFAWPVPTRRLEKKTNDYCVFLTFLKSKLLLE